MASNPSIIITSLRGGLNDNDPPMVLENDSCTIAKNVEFFYSTMGERRLGCTKITDLPSSISADVNIQAVTWMGRHTPDNTLVTAELWALGQHLGDANNILARRTSTAWATVTPDDAITVTAGRGHQLYGVSLHGKFFIAYKSGVDQLHVWDGGSLRKCGLAAPVAPTGANTGADAFSGTRYYRVRYTKMSGASVLLRSEPSSVLTFVPSGTGSGVQINKPVSISQGETHWELEASTDNNTSNFYRIAQTAVGTVSFTDTVNFSAGYASSGALSEVLTSYTPIPSGKFLSVDADRLLIAGSWENPIYGSRIWWTPVFGNTGSGNDERLDMTVNPYIDLDGYEGGEITGLSRAVNGYLYAFKWGHIYKVARTGIRTSAYSAIPLTKARGAIPNSLVEAVDQTGSPAQYFLDPKVGPMRIGQYGIEWCGRDLRNLWSRVNLSATTIAHGVFYPTKNQVHFWVALDGEDHPNAKIVVQCNEMRSYYYQNDGEGARKGWSTVPVGDVIADAHCSIMFDSNVDTTSARNQNLVPLIGKEQWTTKDLIQKCDMGTDDAGTPYFGVVQTKPFLPTGLLMRNGIMASTLMASSIEEPDNSVYLKTIRDFGAEDATITVDLTKQSSEEIFVKELDDANFSHLSAVQFTFGDLNEDIDPSTSWRLHAFAAKVRQEETQ